VPVDAGYRKEIPMTPITHARVDSDRAKQIAIGTLFAAAVFWLFGERLDAQDMPSPRSGPAEASATPRHADGQLARRILSDSDLTDVLQRAKAIVATGFNAGDGYGEVWIRDLATFIELSCQVRDPAEIERNLLMFFRFQGDDGNVIDGFVPAEKAQVNYQYVKRAGVPDFLGHKNTVETDQESSLVQAVYKYVQATGNRSILTKTIDGQTVSTRMGRALEFLLEHRYSEKYGLLWGATTADWGDVQPEHEWGVVLDENSHRAIDIYDNAMFLIAISNYLALEPPAAARWEPVQQAIHRNVRTHLWDERRHKFRPHIYLDGSPFPEKFDEQALFYHGGTAVAIQAGLLSRDEIAASLAQMRDNVRRAGAASIGLTIYPPYPEGFFKNPSMRPYSYQNGGDWTWFGGRMIQALIAQEFVAEAYREIIPMVKRVQENDGFHEWYSVDNRPRGSGTYRGAAGVLGRAIEMLQSWASEQRDE
jgi:glycogen debranching enzyme